MTSPVVISEIREVLSVQEEIQPVTAEDHSALIQVQDGPMTVVSVKEESGVPVEVSEGSPVSVQICEEVLEVAELAVGFQGPRGERGLNWCGTYEPERDYVPDDLVRDGGSLFISLLPSRNVATTNESYWEVLLPSGGDISYRYQQITPVSTWVVSHNLGKYPAVAVVDSAGTSVDGLVEYIDLNQLQITFSAPFAGDAFLN